MSDLTQEDPATQTTVVLTSVANVELVPDPDPPGGAIPGIVTYKVKTGTLTYHSALKYPGCHGENTKTTTMVPGPPGAMGEGLTVISLQHLRYQREAAIRPHQPPTRRRVNTFTLMCEDGDITMTNPNSNGQLVGAPGPRLRSKAGRHGDGGAPGEEQCPARSRRGALYKVDNLDIECDTGRRLDLYRCEPDEFRKSLFSDDPNAPPPGGQRART
jgi:hypothetical protein